MPSFEVSGASLYYEIHAQRSDAATPWLVFAHGAAGNHLSWWQQVPAFAGRFRCVTFDQRGWGHSACDGAPDPNCFGSDLLALLDHVGAQRAALVGQSMGGWAVMGCAQLAPERVTHLVLTGTLAGLTDDAMLAQLVARNDPQRPFDGRLALAPNFPDTDPVRTFLYEQIAALSPPPSPEFLRALVLLRYPAAAERLHMPVCFIAGACDQLFPRDLIEQARAQVPAAELVMVPEAGHSVYFERPHEFNRALASFLDRAAT